MLEEAVLHPESPAAPGSLSYLDLLAEDAEHEPADGRAARSHRTRRAIINAMRALHSDGELRPTAPKIAERAGVSLRTVWQQFTDMEALLVEAVKRDSEILRSLVRKIEPDQPLATRVDSFVSQRAQVLEEMTPTWRAARIHQSASAELRIDHRKKTAAGRAELRGGLRARVRSARRSPARSARRVAARDQHLVVLGIAAY